MIITSVTMSQMVTAYMLLVAPESEKVWVHDAVRIAKLLTSWYSSAKKKSNTKKKKSNTKKKREKIQCSEKKMQ